MDDSKGPAPLRILLAMAPALLRTGVRQMLERRLERAHVIEANAGADAVQAVIEQAPDLVILATCTPGLDSSQMSEIAAGGARKVLLLAPQQQPEELGQALRSGVAGVLSSSSGEDEMFDAIDAILDGQTYVARSLTQSLVHALRSGPEPSVELTKREREILELIAEGLSSREVSDRIGIAQRTVESHRSHLMEKLGARNTAALVRAAIRLGIVE